MWKWVCGLLLGASVTSGQFSDSIFFHIASPSNTAISAFDPIAGTISWSNGLAGVTNQLQWSMDLVATNGWADYVMLVSTGTVSTSEQLVDLNPPDGMGFIPAGVFLKGDAFAEGTAEEVPVQAVHTVGFYMDRTEVTKAQWDSVYSWAVTNGYGFDNAGSGKAPDHPVQTVNWYDCVKWCNARSQQAGLTPCYMVGTNIYRTGQSQPDCDWDAHGYRLPSGEEWEKADRGGWNSRRFPWGDTISHSNANYFSTWTISKPYYSYDVNPYSGYVQAYNDGVVPYTSPVGSFVPNGYGLYDMTGNVWEWCWDLFASTPSGPYRELRGGCWSEPAYYCRASSWYGSKASDKFNFVGFRTVLPTN